METIVTPVTVITLDSTKITHNIKADLVARYFPPVVRLVQYDMSLPVIAVSLMQNGQTYTLPSGAAANIRVHKPDATYVYNPALGCDSTRNIVYFEVTQAMAAASGDGLAIVEIVVNGDIAGTSLITLHFEENPVPEDAIESSDEWETIYELGERIIASTVTPVSTAAGMTDHNVVYLYTGTESGWNQGHIYYYNGTTWVDAGIAVTDKTLTVEGLAADAKKTGEEIADLKDGLDAVTDQINATLITDTASGLIASFPDGADGVPVKSLTVDIEPVQSGSGDPSPTNVRPISGHTSATVTRTGKNVLKPWITNQTKNGITYTVNSDGSISTSGTASDNSQILSTRFVLPKGDYILNGCPVGGSTGTYYLRILLYRGSSLVSSYSDIGNGVQFTVDDGMELITFVSINNGKTAPSDAWYPMIRPVSITDATYESYTAETYIIDLDGTRYGGTLDVTTGVLTVDSAFVDLGTLDWTYYTSGTNPIFYAEPTGHVAYTNGQTLDILCSNYGVGNPAAARSTLASNLPDKTYSWISGAVGSFTVRDSAYTSAAAFKTAMDGVKLVYPLATPFTVQLTAEDDITTLKGQNNIWNDCGNTEVEYRADTKLYIQKVINS